MAVLSTGMGSTAATARFKSKLLFGGSRDVVRTGPLLSLQTTVGGGSLVNRAVDAPPPPPPPPPPRPMYAMTQSQADADAGPPLALIAAAVGALALVGVVVAKKMKKR